MEREKQIKIIELETGIKWPFYNEKKALSASFLTKVLRDNEYINIPKHVLLKAAERGKNFHKIIQDFLEKKQYPNFFILKEDRPSMELSKIELRLFKTIKFLEKQELIITSKFIGSEQLSYIFYKDTLLATYVDLEFEDFIIELKTNSASYKKNPIMILTFELQILIQYLCNNKKKIFILWNTEEGIFFEEFAPSETLIEILDFLINLNGKTELMKTEDIIKKIMENYIPKIIVFK